MRYFQDVESEFRFYVRQLVFLVRNRVAVFLFQLGVQQRDGAIRAHRMAFIVGGIVSERPEGKGVAVEVFGIADKRQDEITAAHVVGQITEEETSVRVVTHVLNNGPAVRVTMRFLELFAGCIRKALEQQRAYVGVPGDVNDGFMRQHGVGRGLAGPAQSQGERRKNGKTFGYNSPAASHVDDRHPILILAYFYLSENLFAARQIRRALNDSIWCGPG